MNWSSLSKALHVFGWAWVYPVEIRFRFLVVFSAAACHLVDRLGDPSYVFFLRISFNTQICYIGAWYYAVFQFICAVPHQRLSARPSVLGVFEDDEAGQIARCADAKAGSYIN